MFVVALAATVVLVGVLAVSGLALTWTYRPPPDDPTAWRFLHRSASVLLLPATWTLVAARVGMARRRSWPLPAALAVAALAAAFTGYLLPWDAVTVPTAVVPPTFSGLGVAFDGRVSVVEVGGGMLARSTYQRYVLAHVGLGVVVVVLATAATLRWRRS